MILRSFSGPLVHSKGPQHLLYSSTKVFIVYFLRINGHIILGFFGLLSKESGDSVPRTPRCKDARAIVENLGQEVATMEHFGVGPVGENGPLEAVSPSSERLGCEPVADSTLAIVVPAGVFGTVAGFLRP